MASILDRLFPAGEKPAPVDPGIYHRMVPDDAEWPYRLHLRVEPDGSGVLIVNAATILHLNPTAVEHALLIVKGEAAENAAETISNRYQISRRRALSDNNALREQITVLATNPDVDPVVFLGMDRSEPADIQPSAPFRLDCGLTYRIDLEGNQDPLARTRVDRELTTDEWKKLLSKTWEAGIPHVVFTGGEPTLRDDLPVLVAAAESLGQVTGVITNGQRLKDEAYLEELSQAGLDHLLIALSPGTPLNQPGLMNALASEIFSAVHLTLSPSDPAEIESRISTLKELGVRAISLSATDKSDSMTEMMNQARDLVAEYDLDLIWDLPAPYAEINPIANELEVPPIGAGRTWLYVEPDGDVLPSQGVDRILGNLLKDDWETVWENAQS